MPYPQFPMPNETVGAPDHVPWSNQVKSKLNSHVDVKADFGAVGNDVADDTAALQNGLDETGRIYVPPGTYKLTGQLNVASNSSIVGAGSSSVLHTTGAVNTLRCGAGASNVSIQDLAISNNPAGGSAIVLEGATNFQVVRCEISDGYKGIDIFNSCADGLVEGCYLHDLVEQCFQVNTGSTGIRIYSNLVENIGSTALNHGLYLREATDVVVSNNVFRSVAGYGIHLFSFTSGSSRISLGGNVMVNCGGGSPSNSGGGLTIGADTFQYSDIVVADNVIQGCDGYGMRLSGVDRTAVSGNVISVNAYYGIYCEALSGINFGVTIAGNTIVGNSTGSTFADGISFAGSAGTVKSAVVTGNTIRDHAGGTSMGVRSAGVFDKVLLVSNDIRGNNTAVNLVGASNVDEHNITV